MLKPDTRRFIPNSAHQTKVPINAQEIFSFSQSGLHLSAKMMDEQAAVASLSLHVVLHPIFKEVSELRL